MSSNEHELGQGQQEVSGIHTLTLSQVAEVDALWSAVGGALAEGPNRACLVRRSKSTEVNGVIIEIGQNLSSFVPNPDLSPPKSLDDLVNGSWPREHHLIADGSSQLWFATTDQASNSIEEWLQPPQGSKATNLGNEGLFDPFTQEVILFDDPDYKDKWETITRWLLDELDKDSQVELVELWCFNEGPYGSKPLLHGSPYSIIEFGKTHLLKTGADINQTDVYPEARILVWDESKNRESAAVNAELFFNPQQANLIIHGSKEEEPINPYVYDPHYIRKLTEIVLDTRKPV